MAEAKPSEVSPSSVISSKWLSISTNIEREAFVIRKL